jgi:Putative metallopeptidase
MSNKIRDCNFHTVPLFLILSLCLGTACHTRKESSGIQNQNSTVQPQQGTSGGADVLDKGDLKLRYQPRKSSKRSTTARKVASNPQVLEQVVEVLNQRIVLPWDITLSCEDCEEPDAYYDPETRQLRICYQLIDEYYDLFGPKIKDEDKLDEAVRGAVASTFFHELGHALVDAWQIPITGKEEDAVDQLSTLVLIRNTERGERLALAGALSFKLYADLDKGQAKLYWDEHSLDEQRFYDTICLIYGHAPEKYAYLVQDGTLPVERAEICREDYPKVARSWHQLLSPYLKHPDQARAADGAK